MTSKVGRSASAADEFSRGGPAWSLLRRWEKGASIFPRVISLLQRGNFDGWVVVEADVLPGGVGADAPLANARAGREYLHRLGI